MPPDFPSDELLAAYRERTRKPGPTRLGQNIRDRLVRSTEVLPRVAVTCLASAAGLAALATVLLTTRDLGGPNQSADPPPMFQSAQGDLFQPSALPAQTIR